MPAAHRQQKVVCATRNDFYNNFRKQSILMSTEPEPSSPLPIVIIKSRHAMPFFYRHPWVFAGAIQKVDQELPAGTMVDVRTHKNEFIAHGLFNPNSNIRVRLYSWNEGALFDEAFWSNKIDQAIGHRKLLFPNANDKTACRLIQSEADGISGLTVDQYGDWLLVQLTSAALGVYQEVIFKLLEEKLSPQGIWLRTEKGIRELEGLEIEDGLLSGDEPPRPLFIEEQGVQFGVDVTQGQKTGFFLDQRDNRMAVCRYIAGHEILDLFCYSGPFGITALKLGEAKSVIGVDSSAPAIELAKQNATLNGVADRTEYVQAKVFDQLEKYRDENRMFDTVIVDPPKMTRHRKGLSQAMRGYHSLNELSVGRIRPGGILVSCSCSGLVDHEMMVKMLGDVAIKSNRNIQIIERRGAAADHPVSVHCKENDYLKCYICRVS